MSDLQFIMYKVFLGKRVNKSSDVLYWAKKKLSLLREQFFHALWFNL